MNAPVKRFEAGGRVMTPQKYGLILNDSILMAEPESMGGDVWRCLAMAVDFMPFPPLLETDCKDFHHKTV